MSKKNTGARSHSRTDFDHLDRVTDAEITKAVVGDPDGAPIDLDWSKARVVYRAEKVPISIRLDADILDWFKKGGSGYQGRINAVLRSYVEAQE